MTPKSIIRAANTRVSELQIFNGENSTVVVGAPGSGKNAMLMGMLMQRGVSDCTMIVTEMRASDMAEKLGAGALVVNGGLDLESLVGAVAFACTQSRSDIFIEHVSPILGHNIVEILEAIAKPFNKRIYVGMQASRGCL
ncbi:hypothetical protein KVP40.0151 [Vibrio phage KVP40]|uniref:Uncharacterized protein n=1 Tax=Vibrio phage KVP40 (isolate Vibrio parahaemolyticus/Japan/Matsuzaki/1991) TaxID=75320 RepID=Q6WI03_BPKVM|nr:hypothetical protein KVP40.0151 [Vibrio phage KVP40]AAQ64220.1 hypothetical protein KVP40.0151 [Vibrio phage KVP40]